MNLLQIEPKKNNGIVPVIIIEGEEGSGMTTVAVEVARRLKFHRFELGKWLRVLCVQCLRKGISARDNKGLAKLAHRLDVAFKGGSAFLEGKNITRLLRSKKVNSFYKKIVRARCLKLAIRSFLERICKLADFIGLVIEGDKVGCYARTPHRFFLEARHETRAKRRPADPVGISGAIKAHSHAYRLDTHVCDAKGIANVIVQYYGMKTAAVSERL